MNRRRILSSCLVVQRSQRQVAIRDDADLVAVGLEVEGQTLRQVVLVFDDQNPRHARVRFAPASEAPP